MSENSAIVLELGVIKGKLDIVIANQEAGRVDKRDVDKRLNKLEQRQAIHTGAAAVISGTISAYFTHYGFHWPFS